MTKEILLKIEKINFILGGMALLGSLYWTSPKLSFSILAGFLIVFINFWLLKTIIFKLLQEKSNKLRLAVVLGIKYVLLLALIGISITYFNLHVGGLLIGISTLVIAIIWNTVLIGIKLCRD